MNDLPDESESEQGALEKLVRGSGFEDAPDWLERIGTHSRAVCRISFRTSNHWRPVASGFLVAPDLVLTNYHVMEQVIKGAATINNVRFQFGYAIPASEPVNREEAHASSIV